MNVSLSGASISDIFLCLTLGCELTTRSIESSGRHVYSYPFLSSRPIFSASDDLVNVIPDAIQGGHGPGNCINFPL